MRRLLQSLVMVLSLACMSMAGAETLPTDGGTTCPDSGIFTRGGMITDICWTCFFPMRFGAVFGSLKNVPDDIAPPTCLCPGRFGIPSPGITAGMWAPAHILEVTRKAWCMPALGIDAGKNLKSTALTLKQGGYYYAGGEDNGGSSFKHFHYYEFPASAVLDLIADAACSSKMSTDIDLLYFSELDPTFDDDELSIFTTPEAVLFSSPVAVAACAADAVASSTYKPLRQMPWCAGSWGHMYPYTGNTNYHTSAVREASLLSMRGLAAMHRRLIAKRTYGAGAVCSDVPSLMLPKQQYRTQVMYPLPERHSNHWLGAETITAGTEWRHIPIKGEDWDLLEWRYAECCVTAY